MLTPWALVGAALTNVEAAMTAAIGMNCMTETKEWKGKKMMMVPSKHTNHGFYTQSTLPNEARDGLERYFWDG
jgi:hypothetical protein